MNIKEAKNEIKHTLLAYLRKNEKGGYIYPLVRQRPILLMGPPGIGKTAIMEQIAEECQVGLVAYTITHHTRQSAVGLPKIVTRNYGGKEMDITEYTMSEIIASVYECMEHTGKKEGILFVDEINCVSETLAPAMLQFLQNKTFGTHKVPKGWIIVAAGNPPEYNKSVREFDIVTLDRVRKLEIQAQTDVWLEYAGKRQAHGAILSYLTLKKENFYIVENTVDGKFFVTARGWEDLSELLKSYEELQVEVSEEIVGEFLQKEEITRDFAAYYRLYERYKTDYRVGEILEETVPQKEYRLICEMAAYYRSIGSSLKQRLEEIYAQYGRYLNKVDSFEFPGLSGMDKMAAIMQGLRENPLTEIAGYKVVNVTDYQKPEETGLPAANVLIYKLENNETVIVRPSGTEPKIKIYYTTLGKNLAEAEAEKEKLAAAIEPMLV